MAEYIPYHVMMERLNGKNGPFEDMRKYPEKYYVPPVKIIKNLYYVGDKMVCIHLVDTGDGLVLIDAGYPTNRALLIQAIWASGHNPADIKYIILTHEHYDHFGAADFMRTMFGCKIVASVPTAEILRDHPERAMIDNGHSYLEPCSVDITVEDGEKMTVGAVTFTFYLTPGHGEGVLTIVFPLTDEDGKEYCCALFGGATTVTMYQEHLKRMGIRLSIWEDFVQSLDRMRQIEVDIVLGNHPRQNDSMGKIARIVPGGQNPFIDPTEWKRFLERTKSDFLEWCQADLAWEANRGKD